MANEQDPEPEDLADSAVPEHDGDKEVQDISGEGGGGDDAKDKSEAEAEGAVQTKTEKETVQSKAEEGLSKIEEEAEQNKEDEGEVRNKFEEGDGDTQARIQEAQQGEDQEQDHVFKDPNLKDQQVKIKPALKKSKGDTAKKKEGKPKESQQKKPKKAKIDAPTTEIEEKDENLKSESKRKVSMSEQQKRSSAALQSISFARSVGSSLGRSIHKIPSRSRSRMSTESFSSDSDSLDRESSKIVKGASSLLKAKMKKARMSREDVEDKPETKKKLKGQKRKGRKLEEAEDVVYEEKEISTQEAEIEAKVQVDEPLPPPKEGKKKKGMKKPKKVKELPPKEKARLEEERKRQEEERIAREAEELRIRLIVERKAAMEKEKREIVEQQLRIEQLEVSKECINEFQKAGYDAYMADKIKDEWDNYLVCDGRPDPSDVPQMNTYLHIWQNEIETMTTDLAIYRTNEMYNLLEKLQELIDDPFDVSESKQADWKWIRSMFRDLQKDNLNFCTYRLIRNIDTKLNRIDIPTADFRLKEENFSLCLWVPVPLPIPIPNPRNPSRPRVQMDWPEMSMNVLFPNSLDCERLVLRAMYVRYNHLSDISVSYADPPIPTLLNKELSEVTANEWRIKLFYKYSKRIVEPKERVTTTVEGETIAIEPEPEPNMEQGQLPPIVPYQRLEPTASAHALEIEDKAIAEAKRALEAVVGDEVVNLRKYAILGGVYYLDLFVQPTQPQEMVSFEIFITNCKPRIKQDVLTFRIVILPCRIEKAPFYVEYLPPPPPAPGVRRQPEEIEEELIKQEQEFDKLIFITLQLPAHILWMDVPLICHWDEDTNEWTTADVHDFKHIEEKGYVTFRTGKFGPFAIATYKYPNFPFQAWELRPESDGSVTFQITAAILLIEFHVKDHMVCLTQVQNAPNKVMDQHLNVYYKLPRLIRIMREAGVDIFPAFDTFFYVEGTCEKYWPMEHSTYYGMAMTAIAYNFSWSRWNMTSDYRTIVMQARIYRFDKPKQLNFSTCMITPLKAVMIECTEVSPAFSSEPSEGMKFYADFYHLIKGTANMATKDRINESNLAMVNSLANLLIATRFLSFS